MAQEKYKVGDRFGNWTLLEKLPVRKLGNSRWKCRCECGVIKEVDAGNVYTGKSKMCGSCGAKKRWREGRGFK